MYCSLNLAVQLANQRSSSALVLADPCSFEQFRLQDIQPYPFVSSDLNHASLGIRTRRGCDPPCLRLSVSFFCTSVLHLHLFSRREKSSNVQDHSGRLRGCRRCHRSCHNRCNIHYPQRQDICEHRDNDNDSLNTFLNRSTSPCPRRTHPESSDSDTSASRPKWHLPIWLPRPCCRPPSSSIPNILFRSPHSQPKLGGRAHNPLFPLPPLRRPRK